MRVTAAELGFVDDVIDRYQMCAKIVSLVIFGRSSFLGFIGKCEDYIIPWEKIELIGEDTIIISCSMPNPVKGAKSQDLKRNSKKIDFLPILHNPLRSIR